MSSPHAVPRAASASPSATNSSRGGSGRPCAFPKWRRLRARAEFRAVYDGGVRTGASLVTVFALPTGAARPARVGLTVTRRVGNAVTRNRCKRALRETVRQHWGMLPTGMDIILHAKPRAARARARDLESQVFRVLREAVRRSGS